MTAATNPSVRKLPDTRRLVDPARVALVADSMPEPSVISDVADVYSLLGDQNRVRLLVALLDGPMAVRDIAAVIERSESAVSHALRLLRAHRVVDVRRVGRVAYYEIADSHVRSLLEMGLKHVGHTVLLHHRADGEVSELLTSAASDGSR